MVLTMQKRSGFTGLLQKTAAQIYAYLQRAHADVQRDSFLGQYDIHDSVRWNDQTWFYGDGAIHIGENTYLGKDCFVSSHPATASITVGKGCAIGHNVHIRTTTFPRVPHFEKARDLPPESKDIVIGDFVWIGNHVYIGPGIRIGSNSIIGANSVVTKDVPPDTVVGGVPAQVIGTKDGYIDAVASEAELERITTLQNS